MTSHQKGFITFLNKALAQAEKMPEEDKLLSYKSVLFPKVFSSPETFKSLETFEARSDDVILAAYPKSGTNWFLHILYELARTAKKSEDDLRDKMESEEDYVFPYLEFGDAGKFERLNKLPSPRILSTHLPPSMLPKSIFKNKAKVLVLVRNPKDVATSYFHFMNKNPAIPTIKSWDEFFRAFINGKVPRGSYFENLLEWSKYFDDKNIMFITYEEVKTDLALGVKKMADFGGFLVSQEEIESIVVKSSFQKMKENAQFTHGAFGNMLFNKGVICNWKNLFSEAQSQEMDQRFEECLGGTKLGAMMKYEVYCQP